MADDMPESDDTTDVSDEASQPSTDSTAQAGSGESADVTTDESPQDVDAEPAAVSPKAKDAAPKDTESAATAAAPVVKKKIVSKRITPKSGATPGSTAAHAHAPGGHDASGSKRYTPPTAKYDQMPSPTWVPILMFVLFGIGFVVIVANYARAFGEPDNWRTLVGLAAILGGIITATNYR